MVRYEGETMEPIPPALGTGERELILVTHDECIFYSNDGKKRIWVSDGEKPLRKKGNGRSIMVSEFLLEACGRLQLSEEEKRIHQMFPQKHAVTLHPAEIKKVTGQLKIC